MEREAILAEIRRVAQVAGVDAVGRTRFERLTEISEGEWLGRYWARWSDAVAEAGLSAGKMQAAHDEEVLLDSLARLVRKYGRPPTFAELKLERRSDKAIPSHNVFARLGGEAERVSRLREFLKGKDKYRDLVSLVPEQAESPSKQSESPSAELEGFVYMLKLGKHFKIGRTNAVPRRHREISLELPEKPQYVHAIRTDDPEGIEGYWHRRFAEKRTNGEWFALGSEEIRAFKRRRFM